eukprot:g5464.t1
MAASQVNRDDDVMRILIFTDTHLGHKDTDEILGQDSIETFEEILKIAKDNKVDFILHAGDLFDENKPSRGTLYQTFNLLSKYCMGDLPIHVHVSHVDEHAYLAAKEANFYDPNYNASLPEINASSVNGFFDPPRIRIFMIHGNHDDPGGLHKLSANDLLSANRLVNYFGRQPDVDNVRMGPICIEKNGTKLALYGLGNVRDERLNRTFENDKVTWIQPGPGSEKGGKDCDPEDWFNVMMIHQNRFKGNFGTTDVYLCIYASLLIRILLLVEFETSVGGKPNKQCVKEEQLPDWLNLVIWGHEHESKSVPVESKSGNYHIVQPGSSVATSYIQAEAVAKHVCYLELRGKEYRCSKVPLRTVRPFKIDEIVLKEYEGLPVQVYKKEAAVAVRPGGGAGDAGEVGVAGKKKTSKSLLQLVRDHGDHDAGSSRQKGVDPGDHLVDGGNSQVLDPTNQKALWDLLSAHVDKLIKLAHEEQSLKPEHLRAPSSKLPLVRLKVDYTDFPCNIIGNSRFGQQFVGRVGNPDALLLFTKKAARSGAGGGRRNLGENRIPALDENGEIKHDEFGNTIFLNEFGEEVVCDEDGNVIGGGEDPAGGVDNMDPNGIADPNDPNPHKIATDRNKANEEQQRSMGDLLFNLMPKQDFSILPLQDFNHAVLSYVEKSDAGSIERFVKATIEATNKELFQAPKEAVTAEVDTILMAMKQRREAIRCDAKERVKTAEAQKMEDIDDYMGGVSDEDLELNPPGMFGGNPGGAASGKAKAKAKGKAKAKARGKAKSKAGGSSSSRSSSARGASPQMGGFGRLLEQGQGLPPPVKKQKLEPEIGGGFSQLQQGNAMMHGGMQAQLGGGVARGTNLISQMQQSQIGRPTGGAMGGTMQQSQIRPAGGAMGTTQSQRKLPWAKK